tara:strand:- start:21564 stop:22307 length:744 start_codon:yes stop_codon:yes gene_type:complete
MTLPSSGNPISLYQVGDELDNSALDSSWSASTISLNDSNVRTLAEVSSGAISLSNLYGKSNVTDLASPTLSMRVAGSGNATEGTLQNTGAIGSVILNHSIKITRNSGNTVCEIKEGTTSPTSNWYNTSGSSSSLSSTYTTMWTHAVSLDAVKINWSKTVSDGNSAENSNYHGGTYTLSDNTWRTLSATESAGINLNASSLPAECFNREDVDVVWTLVFYGRKSGYNDTELCSMKVDLSGYFQSNNCF